MHERNDQESFSLLGIGERERIGLSGARVGPRGRSSARRLSLTSIIRYEIITVIIHCAGPSDWKLCLRAEDQYQEHRLGEPPRNVHLRGSSGRVGGTQRDRRNERGRDRRVGASTKPNDLLRFWLRRRGLWPSFVLGGRGGNFRVTSAPRRIPAPEI